MRPKYPGEFGRSEKDALSLSNHLTKHMIDADPITVHQCILSWAENLLYPVTLDLMYKVPQYSRCKYHTHQDRSESVRFRTSPKHPEREKQAKSAGHATSDGTYKPLKRKLQSPISETFSPSPSSTSRITRPLFLLSVQSRSLHARILQGWLFARRSQQAQTPN